MACRRFGIKPFHKSMLAYSTLDSEQRILNQNTAIVIQENEFENVGGQNGGHFVMASTYQNALTCLPMYCVRCTLSLCFMCHVSFPSGHAMQ